MRPRVSRHVLLGCALFILVAPAVPSATLGGDRASIEADRIRAQGALMRVSTLDSYAVHEMRSAPGTMLREYVSATGNVFGVAWDGPWMPDMQQLLGQYYDTYQTAALAAQRHRRGHGPLVIDTPDFVISVSGHPQAFSGHAYLPRSLPAGVRPESIQ